MSQGHVYVIDDNYRPGDEVTPALRIRLANGPDVDIVENVYGDDCYLSLFAPIDAWKHIFGWPEFAAGLATLGVADEGMSPLRRDAVAALLDRLGVRRVTEDEWYRGEPA